MRLTTMRICLELGKDLKEVSNWPLSDLVDWEAFFRIKWEAEKAAVNAAKQGGSTPRRKGVTVIND
jgi:hypothetical protein